MIELYIIALIGQFFSSILYRMIQDLVHTSHVGPDADDGRQVLQCRLHGIVQSGHYQKEQKECQHIQGSF